MLRTANILVRAAIVLVVAVFTLSGPRPDPVELFVQVVALLLATFLVVQRLPTDRSSPLSGRLAGILPYGLGAIAISSGLAAATPTGGLCIILAVLATICAASDASPTAAWVVAVLGAAATVAAGLLLGAGTSVTIYDPVLFGAGLVLGHNLRAYRVQAEQLEQLREEQARLAALDERNRLAREIHDVLAHSLGALGVQIQVTRAVLREHNDVARAVALLDQAQRMASDGLTETRRAIQALRGETQALPEALRDLGANHQRRYGGSVALEVTGAPRALSPDAGLALTRTAQEALVNTAKHAPHEPVEVHLDYAAAETCLVVRNRLGDGDGADQGVALVTVNGGYGLAGVRERLLLIDGTLSAGQDGADWVVVARVPQ
jgi:signal transduction histidine kinase